VAGCALALLLVVVAGTGAALGGLLALGSGRLPATVPARGDDAVWLGHGWAGGQRDDAALAALIARLRQTGIRDVFVHVGPLSANGSLNPALRPRARWLLAGLRRGLPGLRVQAWLGDLVGPGQLDLASAATRRRILSAAVQVLAQGFG
jgi:hypothetical protein